MSGPLLRHQPDLSAPVPMPTDRVDDASTVNVSTAETVTWFYVSSGAWASATGQAAGTLVWGKLTYDGVLNSNRATVGSFNNTSLSLGASTRLDTLISVPEDVFNRIQFMSPTDQKAVMATYLTTNGYYAIDHRRGQIWGLQKATVADDSATYYYKAPIAGGGGPSSNVAVTSIVPGTGATNLGKAEDSAHSSGDVGVMDLGVSNEGQAQLSSTDGEYTPKAVSTRGNTYVEGNKDHGSTDSGYPVKVGGKYNSTPPTLSANQRGDLQLDVSANLKIAEQFTAQAEDNTLGVVYTLEKPIASSTNAVTLDTSSAAEASSVSKASAGRLYGFVFSNANGATRYLQFFNATSVPADTAVPFLVFKVGTGETLQIEFPKGIPFSTGICWCNSSTQNSKTIGSADSLANVFYT